MDYSILELNPARQITLCGTNYYPTPEYHVDRILPEHDLMFMYEGEWQIAQDDAVYTLKPGDLLFLHAGGHHWGTSPCSVNARNLFVHFSALESDRHHVFLSPHETHAYATGNKICIPPLIHIGLENQITDLFSSIISLYWSHQEDRHRRLSIMLSLLLNDLSYAARRNFSTSEEWIVKLLSLFHNDMARLYTLNECAEITGMNVRTLSSRFARLMGKSLHQYQVDEKLEGAYSQLRTGMYSVKEVALTFGFTDPYYFSRAFKKHFGVAPSRIVRREPSSNVNRPQFD